MGPCDKLCATPRSGGTSSNTVPSKGATVMECASWSRWVTEVATGDRPAFFVRRGVVLRRSGASECCFLPQQPHNTCTTSPKVSGIAIASSGSSRVRFNRSYGFSRSKHCMDEDLELYPMEVAANAPMTPSIAVRGGARELNNSAYTWPHDDSSRNKPDIVTFFVLGGAAVGEYCNDAAVALEAARGPDCTVGGTAASRGEGGGALVPLGTLLPRGWACRLQGAAGGRLAPTQWYVRGGTTLNVVPPP